MTSRIIIVGAGMATAYLLQELAQHRHALDISVIGEEARGCYNRVLLSGVLAGENSESDLDMLDDLEGCPGVNFFLGTRVDKIDLALRTVTTDGGKTLPYDYLVFATGALIARPKLDTAGAGGVEALRTLDDVVRLKNMAVKGGRAIVVGGGLLGLEAAHGLNELGLATTVLHRRPWLMNRQLDREGGELLQSILEHKGIEFCLEDSVAALHLDGQRLRGIRLEGGQEQGCDLLVFATGIKPNKALPQLAGLACDRGVLVDENMRASDDRCYALGECSQMGEQCFGLVAPIRRQAAVLARQLAGVPGEGYTPGESATQLKIAGVEIFSAGPVDMAGEVLLVRDRVRGVYRRLVLREGRLVSAVLVGDKREGNWYQELISSGADVSALRRHLMFGRDVCDAVRQTARAA